jgi:inorganic pyrophosphatase
VLLLAAACRHAPSSQKIEDYEALPAFTERGVNVVVEIPAGTNLKIEYDKTRRVFAPNLENGEKRVVRFLPYPANYGFIPSTYMDSDSGGDGDALDALLICSSLPSGTVVEALPIGALRLKDRDELDTKIIAVPLDEALRVIDAVNFRDFLIEYDAARRIIEEWFLHYKGFGLIELLSWEDEAFARRHIEEWLIR